jgi:hypothetical protein
MRAMPDRVEQTAAAKPPAVRKFFISYAHAEAEERELAAWLRASLNEAGHEVFIDTDIPLGTCWAEEVERRLQWCDFLLVLLSAASVRSEMVTEEVRRAREQRRANGRPSILPLRVKYDGDLGYTLGAFLQPLQWLSWDGQSSSARVRQAILCVATDSAMPPEISATQTSTLQTSPLPSALAARPQPTASPLPGAMYPEDPFYIARDADARVLKVAAARGQTLTIQAPRQIGKSSLLQRYLSACTESGSRFVMVDFSVLSEADFHDYAALLGCIAAEVRHELAADSPPPAVHNSQQFTHWLEDLLRQQPNEPLTLACDEADGVFDRPYRRDFFKMLRSWQNRRALKPAWRKLGLALVISTERHLLIDDARDSPFNVGLHVALQPFTLAECRELNWRHEEHEGQSLPDDEVAQLWQLLRGQPYLTREAFRALLAGRLDDAAELPGDAEREDGIFADHLRALLNRLQARPEFNLVAALRRVIQGEQVADQAAITRLKAAGLVRHEGSRAVPANELYAHFFGKVL